MKTKTRFLSILSAITALLSLQAFVGCGSFENGSSSGTASKSDIVTTAAQAGDFSTLVTAVEAADLVETLKGKGPFTVFAPNDKAFAKLPEGTLADLLKPENKAKLAGILTYHVVPGKIMAKDIKLGKTNVKTVNGKNITIEKTQDGTVKINNAATVIKADIDCTNGVIHVVDTVILPPKS